MASTLDNQQRSLASTDSRTDAVAAVVTVEDLQDARRDERVHAFLDEADAYLVALEREGRNR